MSLERDLELLYELTSLRFIKRTWTQFLSPGMENDAEHHFRVAWIALTFAKMEGIQDIGKVARMALVHDIAESRTGDVHYVSREYTKRMENEAIHEILRETGAENELLELWKEYEKRESPESKIVKDADNLAVNMELQEQAAMGNPVKNVWTENRKFIYENKLFTPSAKRLWEAIDKSNPHDWHLNARNRFNSGDWKK
ncbi:MAG: HD domain-containing protein [Candidatus Iainarchaeum archaeon]|uniref:5'-deoxynucleotidase n=1 Tax=Candidatus Iainarchaeum sp. TaxID=3101447 RepID=A0A7T9DJI6_9ARCH|nr:MAG: HD domain-containing protein [Candidatus Diapherotrites archaeon]